MTARPMRTSPGLDANLAGAINANGSVDIDAVNNVAIDAAVTATTGDITVDAAEGNVANAAAGTLTATAGAITVNAAGDATFKGNVTANQAIAVTAATGDITFDAMRAYSEASTVTVTAATGDVAQKNAADIVADSNATITATRGNVIVDKVYAGYDVNSSSAVVKNTNAATAAISASAGLIKRNRTDAVADIFADTVTLTAGKGIGTIGANDGDTVKYLGIANATNVTASTTDDTGSIYLNIGKDNGVAPTIDRLNTTMTVSAAGQAADVVVLAPALTSYVDTLTIANITATSGNVAVYAANSDVDIQAIATTKDVDVTANRLRDANEDVAVVQSIKGDNVTLAAWSDGAKIGLIQSTGDTKVFAEGGPITGNGGVSIAAKGSIMLVSSDKIGDVDQKNPMTVEASGKVSVGAFGKFSTKTSIWTLASGKSGDGGIHYAGTWADDHAVPNRTGKFAQTGSAQDAPPGLIVWNSMYYGGAETEVENASKVGNETSNAIQNTIASITETSWLSSRQINSSASVLVDTPYGGHLNEYMYDNSGVLKLQGIDETIDLETLEDSLTWN